MMAMASRATVYWRNILSKYQKCRQFSSSTQFRMQPHASSSSSSSHGGGGGAASGSLRLLKLDFFPIYTIFGMTLLAVSMAILTAKQQVLHSPSVVVDKKKRKDLPEVKDPEFVLKKSEDFVNKSFFRRVGKNTKKDSELSKSMPGINDPDTSNKPVDIIKSVGAKQT